jgi:hypothetical protein
LTGRAGTMILPFAEEVTKGQEEKKRSSEAAL